MKAKVKFDKQSIKEFFVQHCEKMVLGGIVVVFLLMAYSALTRESYGKIPDQLRQTAEEAKRKIENTKPESIPAPPVIDYEKLVKDWEEAIQRMRAQATVGDINPPIFLPQPKRGPPRLYHVEKLVAHSDFGAFALRAGEGAGAAAEERGQRWVVITGLVPLAKQLEAYNEALKGFPRPETDTPKYYSYEVQRADVFGDSRDENPTWTPLDLRTAYAPMANWTSMQVDVVAPAFVSEKLVYPLGPLSSKTWDESVAHPPEILLAADAAAAAEGRTDEGGIGPPPTRAAAGPGTGIVPETGVIGPPGVQRPLASADGAADAADQKYMLFRFFDYSVQPGKRYRYRTKIHLENPNYNIEPRHLTDPALAKEQVISPKDWSEETKPVFVQRDDRLLAGSVKPALKPFLEPEATLTVVKWIADRGVQFNNKFEKITRGQLLNLSGALPGPEGETPDPGLDGDAAPKSAAAKKQPQTLYKTDAFLLDMQGGEKFSLRDKQAEPSYLLILDYDNTLAVRSELEDEVILTKMVASTQTGTNEAAGGVIAPPTSKDASGGIGPPPTTKGKSGAAKKGAAAGPGSGIVEEPTGGLFGGETGKKKKR